MRCRTLETSPRSKQLQTNYRLPKRQETRKSQQQLLKAHALMKNFRRNAQAPADPAELSAALRQDTSIEQAPPPAYSDIYGQVDINQDGFDTRAKVAST